MHWRSPGGLCLWSDEIFRYLNNTFTKILSFIQHRKFLGSCLGQSAPCYMPDCVINSKTYFKNLSWIRLLHRNRNTPHKTQYQYENTYYVLSCTKICDQSDSVTCLSILSLTISDYRSPISSTKRKKIHAKSKLWDCLSVSQFRFSMGTLVLAEMFRVRISI